MLLHHEFSVLTWLSSSSSMIHSSRSTFCLLPYPSRWVAKLWDVAIRTYSSLVTVFSLCTRSKKRGTGFTSFYYPSLLRHVISHISVPFYLDWLLVLFIFIILSKSILMGCFHHEFSVLTCLSSSSSMVYSSRSTFCLLPYRSHFIAKLWPGSSYSSLVTVNSSRGTCFHCPSLLCFTNLLLWPDLLIHCYYISKFLNSHAYSYDFILFLIIYPCKILEGFDLTEILSYESTIQWIIHNHYSYIYMMYAIKAV